MATSTTTTTPTTTTTDLPLTVENHPAQMETKTKHEEKTLNIQIEFTGGLEILFNNQPKHKVSLPASNGPSISTSSQSQSQLQSPSPSPSPSSWKIKDLIPWICENLMVDHRREMFILADGSIRPGILVLINDADWELEGEEMYELQEGDCVLFVSTLHGG